MIPQAVDVILSRALPNGGFRYSDIGPFSPEASAWAALALRACAKRSDTAEEACRMLASVQQQDGRVCAVSGYDGAVWCTPLCILAWRTVSGFRRSIDSGIKFLLTSQGRHHVKAVDSPAGHDTSLVGWPWIENTHSWIEPTSMAMMALKANGYQQHPRTIAAAWMVMDRQLPSGGWNYGNTTVFGRELLPIPENTGQALCALRGMVEKSAVDHSLRYLETMFNKVRTPIALSWIIQAMGMWSRLPKGWKKGVVECLALQDRYGPYDTVALSQLVLAYLREGNLNAILA